MCSDCAFCKSKLTYLGFRNWCRKYKQFHTVKCVDWVRR